MPAHEDFYEQMYQARAAAQTSAAFQALQTGLLVGALGTLDSIHHQMDAIRQATKDSLNAQQEMLRRDSIQRDLEEFIYQMEKVAGEFSKQDCTVDLPTRYFYVQTILKRIARDGIATPIIQGRDNKAAFDSTVHRIDQITKELEQQQEVRLAIAWAHDEQKRQEEKRQRQREEQKRKNAEKKLQLQQMELERQEQIDKLHERIRALKVNRQHLKFADWYKEQWVGKLPKVVQYIGIWYLCCGFMWIPVWFTIAWGNAEMSLNESVNQEIKLLEGSLQKLLNGKPATQVANSA